MSGPRTYTPSVPLGPGRTIVEASAGTGKTFTIAAAVTRLLVEGIELERILVVTFTRAATAELRHRIRRRIVETGRFLHDGGAITADDHMQWLADQSTVTSERARDRLERALTRFDRAQIFTIHGFAQRMLISLGFRSRLGGDLEPQDLDELLLRRAAEDLILGTLTEAPPEMIEALNSGHLEEIGRAVVATPDARLVPAPSDSPNDPAGLRSLMARRIREVVRRRLQESESVTFDDLLVEARDALRDPDVGKGSRDVLQRRYEVALVDEAQDTDPIQWEAIREVFDASGLVVIGDPKQSIYAFRGADIESYLSAADGADAMYTLDTNWRSDGPLLKALDLLLSGVVFGDRRIPYRSVRPAPLHHAHRLVGGGAALKIRRMGQHFNLRRTKAGNFPAQEAREAVAADTANEIARLLMSDVVVKDLAAGDGHPHDPGKGRSLEPGDIAVLCRTRNQVTMVREELSRRGVPSVAARSGGVFESAAAEEWRRFLLAVERPQRFDYVRMALAGLIGGFTLEEVAELTDEDARRHQRRFVRWQELLHDRGVPPMIEDIDRRAGMTAGVLRHPDGARLLTDLRHIGELMHSAWRRGRVGSLVVWLEAAMEEAARNAQANTEDPEDRRRRIDTDAAAVQVQTIHASKGLEFPVVMAPYLWDSFQMSPSIPVYHEQVAAKPGRPRRRLIDVGGKTHPDFKAAQELAKGERAEEESRLLYVALTRARHQLTVWWVDKTYNSEGSELTKVLRKASGRLRSASPAVLEDVSLREPAPLVDYSPPHPPRRPLELARFGRVLDYAWRRVSFTSLSPDHPLDEVEDNTEEADRIDEAEGAVPVPPEDRPEPASVSPVGLDGLPGGARFGSLVHTLLEKVPFDSPDPVGAVVSQYEQLARQSAWSFEPEVLAEALAAVLATPLGPAADAPALRDLDPSTYVKEMAFEMGVRTESSPITVSGIASVVLEHLRGDDPYRSYLSALVRQPGVRFRGYLTGIVDLAAAVPGPEGSRYMVMDFKSNYLTPTSQPPTPEDYGPDPMLSAIWRGNYVLQALLYQVALHRYLIRSLPDYRPERDLGGSAFLFLRGMVGPTTPTIDGERCGVARWHTPPEAVVALSHYLGDGER